MAANPIQLPPIHRQQEIPQKMDCSNHSSILSPKLGLVELSQWQAPWQCWHRSFGEARQIGCKYNIITSIGTYRNDATNSSFSVTRSLSRPLATPCLLPVRDLLLCCFLHVTITIPAIVRSRSGCSCYVLPLSVLPAYLLFISPYIHGDEGVLLADP